MNSPWGETGMFIQLFIVTDLIAKALAKRCRKLVDVEILGLLETPALFVSLPTVSKLSSFIFLVAETSTRFAQ